ncbi:MAG: WYL domain-containing protein [Catenulispora sp.]|nr:WYL domain-containing protein [Catenulispora sp.]
MPATKTERLVNLVICLLASKQYVTKERLRATLEPYRECPTDDAFERMFERDKDELREMGIPLETGTNSALFEDEIGYRIPKDSYNLPEIRLERDEAAVLGVAARFWQQAVLASDASSALLKLKSAGVEVGDVSQSGIEPRVRTETVAFEPLLQAICDRRPVAFHYRKSGEVDPAERRVEPWAIDSWRGHWYLAGYDRGRGADRMFRLDRIVGEVVLLPGHLLEPVPDDMDVHAKVADFAWRQNRNVGTATLRLRADTGFLLRRRATECEPELRDGEPTGWDVLTVPRNTGMAGWLAEFGPDVQVLEPPELRAAVVARLRAAVAGNGLAASDEMTHHGASDGGPQSATVTATVPGSRTADIGPGAGQTTGATR